jgi:hypothetical protein
MRERSVSYYLTAEASQLRLNALVKRIATEGLKPGESVPARILVLADALRGEMRTAA